MGGKAPRKEFPKAGLLKRPLRYWLGIVACHKIHWFQISTKLLIHKHPFSHLVCIIAQEVGKYDMHFQVCMILTLQEAAEYYLVSLQEDDNLCAIHAKHVTIMPKDIQFCLLYLWRPPLLLSSSSSPRSVLLFLLVVGCVGSYWYKGRECNWG